MAYKKINGDILTPSKEIVEKWLDEWNNSKELEHYRIQEKILEEVFRDKTNKDIKVVLKKCTLLNSFYSTNIFKIYDVAKHIVELDIDKRLETGDLDLVKDIATVDFNGTTKVFYSFATKYCSFHRPDVYPIFDSYVEAVLRYFRKKDQFSKFKKEDLSDYPTYKKILLEYIKFYKLDGYSLKEIDRYLWQVGKEHNK